MKHLMIDNCWIIYLPSMSTLKISFKIVDVVARTSTENKNVQIGSATFHSGCMRERIYYFPNCTTNLIERKKEIYCA